MEQIEIKSLIAPFLGIEASDINETTTIDRSVVKNSILIHRMYASLSNAGLEIQNYQGIKTFEDLLNRMGEVSNPIQGNKELKGATANNSIGIDMEEVKNLPIVDDFRTGEFYKKNFTSLEISHCLLQKNPLVSFAGLFALKEAIMKADNSLMNKDLKGIEIQHKSNGSPTFRNFETSISHTENMAVAVAINISHLKELAPIVGESIIEVEKPKENKVNSFLRFLTFLMSLLAFLLHFINL